MDECGFSPSQPVNCSWTVSGERKSIPYENPQRLRINVMAAMIAHGNSGALVRSKESSGSFTSEEFIEFLTQTSEPVAGLKVVVMDNYSSSLQSGAGVFEAIKRHTICQNAPTGVWMNRKTDRLRFRQR